MSERQAKLFRYFISHTNDVALIKNLKSAWPYLPHKAKGRITHWMKRVIVTMMHVADAQKAARVTQNLEALKGFVNV